MINLEQKRDGEADNNVKSRTKSIGTWSKSDRIFVTLDSTNNSDENRNCKYDELYLIFRTKPSEGGQLNSIEKTTAPLTSSIEEICCFGNNN